MLFRSRRAAEHHRAVRKGVAQEEAPSQRRVVGRQQPGADRRPLLVDRLDPAAHECDRVVAKDGSLALQASRERDVVGDGPLRAEYERLAGELGVAGRVEFHGLQPKAELAERMRRADVFVLASRFENNPCVLLEAMASGLPVVATRVGGVPELVDDRSGLLADPRDPAALAARIAEALERDFDREQIAARARERYGREAVGARLAGIYESVARSAAR